MTSIRLLMRSMRVAAILILSFHTSLAQSSVRDYRRVHERQILAEFTRLLAIPNVALIRRTSGATPSSFSNDAKGGLNPQLLEAASKETPPAVLRRMEDSGRDTFNRALRTLRRSADRSEAMDRDVNRGNPFGGRRLWNPAGRLWSCLKERSTLNGDSMRDPLR